MNGSTWQLARRLGITDVRGFVLPIVQSLAIGISFVAVLLVGYHAPHPHDARIDVVGGVAQSMVFDETLQRDQPGAFQVVHAVSLDAAIEALREGRTFGVVDLSTPTTTLFYAGAQGPTVNNTVTAAVTPIARQSGALPAVIDEVPMGTNDAAGLPIFYLVFGVVLSSYIFAISSVNLGARLSPSAHWLNCGIFAILMAASAVGIARFGTGTISSHSLVIGLLLGLLSLAVASGTALLVNASRLWGSLAATVVLITLANASGGVLPGPFLPAWLAVLREILPMGVALTGIRSATYFGSTSVVSTGVILLLWAVLPIVILQLAVIRPKASSRARPDRQPA